MEAKGTETWKWQTQTINSWRCVILKAKGKTNISRWPLSSILLFDGTSSLHSLDHWHPLSSSSIKISKANNLSLSVHISDQLLLKEKQSKRRFLKPSSSLISIASRLNKGRTPIYKEHRVTEDTTSEHCYAGGQRANWQPKTWVPQEHRRTLLRAEVGLQQSNLECWAL